MDSTGGTPDADRYGVDPGDSADDEFAPPRVRRSTYTAPPQYREAFADATGESYPVSAPVAARPAQPGPVAAAPVAPAPVESAAVAPAPVEPAPVEPAPVVAETVASAAQELPVWSPPARETPVWTAPAVTPTAAAEPAGDVWTAPPAAPVIPDWNAQQRVTAPPAEVDPAPAATAPEPLASAPVWAPEPDLPVDPPVEPTSPYRPWTPDSHVDADAYWNTARPPSYVPAEPAVAQPIELVSAPADPEPAAPARVEPTYLEPADAQHGAETAAVEPAPVDDGASVEQPAAPVWSAPVWSAPVWSLDADEPHDPYRAWTPEQTAPEQAAHEQPAPAQPAPEQPAPAQNAPQQPSAPEPAAPPRYMTPDDEASTLAAHAPPVGQPWIPQRRSLPDDELLSVLEAADSEPGGTLHAMDALENEMRLREEEVQEYREWEDSMLAVGTPEALAVVAQVRPEFTAIVIPAELEPTQAIPIQYPAGEQGDGPWPFSEPGEPEVPLLPEPPLQPEQPAEPWPSPAPEVPLEPAPPVEPTVAPELPDAPTTPVSPDEPEVAPDEPGVSHDMPQSWFDALVAPVETPAAGEPVAPAPAPAPQAPVPSTAVAVHTGYPVPNFDQLLAEDPQPEPAEAVPEKRRKLPFGVAVADGQPQNPADAAPAGTAPAPAITEPVAAEPGAAPTRRPIFLLEQAGQRPTARDLRTGRASRMFWLWFAANSSVVSIGLGAMIFSLGMSLRQSVVATLAGVALSFLPLGLGTLAGKRSGQPAVVVSRAAFGVVGNVVPAALALASRVFWGAVLLWLFAASVSTFLGGDGPTAGLVVVFIVVGVMLALVVAFLGYWLLARVQLVISVVSAVLIVGFVALTWQRVDLRAALSVDDGPWVLLLTGAIAVFSLLGLVWANSASDLARYQRPGGSGGSNMLWANFGTTLPSFVLIAYGALLAASDSALGTALVADPVDALTSILPGWYAAPLIVGTALSLLSGVVLASYSGAFALQAVGVRVERQWATLVVGGLVAVLAVGFSLLDVTLVEVFRDLATTVAVPVAAWAGIFAADTMIRNRALHTASLLRVGGVYPKVNWVNLPALVVLTAVGWAFTTATVGGLGWQGYGFTLAGVDPSGDLAGSDLGVLLALVFGLLTPIATGIPAIRRQEAAARQTDRATPK